VALCQLEGGLGYTSLPFIEDKQLAFAGGLQSSDVILIKDFVRSE